jgi:hypothetical protein
MGLVGSSPQFLSHYWLASGDSILGRILAFLGALNILLKCASGCARLQAQDRRSHFAKDFGLRSAATFPFR